ncbi:hypothetical protein [Halorussus sp. MSC15.2]|uniref:hypothetical protein n=1 Tax=Halorussus sp. MSC15.2 TaxID=2283638 RepID=UPI0013D77DE8|nr:hypothetical protein [Halorussus sp. MSC15.2]NEU59129.1 hypothetical protein [Halorussus sp. MSC15.2]
MSGSKSLPTAVEALDDKAKEHKQAQNTKYHVSVARSNISEINSEFDELATRLRDLKYYKTVLEEAFGGSAPTMTAGAVQAIENATGVTQDDLLENVQSDDVGENEVETHLKQIRSAKKQVKSVIQTIENQLESERSAWTTKVEAAEELQKILGGQNADFSRTLNHMHSLLTRELMDTSGSASNFVSEWENATSDWEKHQSLQSFDDFQEKHDLSDDTIEDVKTLSKSQKLTLADVSMETLEEMKRVDEFESAVELSL